MTGARLAGAIALLLVTTPAGAQMTRCASCHFANMAAVPAPEHLGEWQRSAHAKHDVGCDKCHGGDPWTYEPLVAHRGVLASANPSSPVNRANLSRTCAPCHQANAEALSGSLHQTLSSAGDLRAPTCVTCHGVMSARVPSPAALEARCATCHPPGSAWADYPAVMRLGIESLNEVRHRADEMAEAAAGMSDRVLRARRLAAVYDARATLKQAIAAAHGFNVQAVNARVALARRQLEEGRP